MQNVTSKLKAGVSALILGLVLTRGASAAFINGTFGAAWIFTGNGSYTGASDLQDATIINFASPASYTHGTGDFSSFASLSNVNIAPGLPGVGPSSSSITSTPDSVMDFMSFGPSGQYQFNLTSLDEYYSGGTLTFYGYGTVVDTTNVESPSPAEFTANGFNDLGGGSFDGGSFTFAATAPVPEPATLGLFSIAAIGLLRRRRVA